MCKNIKIPFQLYIWLLINAQFCLNNYKIMGRFKQILMSCLCLWLLVRPEQASANALNLTNLVVNQAAGTVTFDITWQNSWRVSTVPFNWDAAWTFVKFRTCGAAPSTEWTHGIISTTIGQHTFGAGLEPILSDGTAVGIDAAPNNLGVMLRRSTDGVYANAAAVTVTLRITNLPAAGDIDVKVFGLEMVFVPQGAYSLADGVSNMYWSISGPTQITSEASVALTTFSAPAQIGNVTLDANYPKGFKAFHCMKYEVSEGQYAGFLNTLASTAQSARYPGAFNSYRNRLNNSGASPNIYVTDRQDRAQNYLGWNDLSTYLDWSCLRPMSELEYHKACRGGGTFIPGEYAWGSTTVVQATQISSTVPSENGTEVILTTNANCSYAGPVYSGGDGGQGPLRVGIFAQPTSSTRQATGASYYGIMELSGNIWELVINSGPAAGAGANVYTGAWGDGYIDNTNGRHNVGSWPPGNVGANDFRVVCVGGGWGTGWDRMRMDDRYDTYYSNANGWFNSRDASVGGRGVR